MSKKKWGFTLPEVLITLAIIGVVAAITIPGLITKLKNMRTEAILKEDFSILQQMMISANDNGAVNLPSTSNNMDIVKSWFETYFLPYIKVANICYDTDGCWVDIQTLSGKAQSSYKNRCGRATIMFILNNGSYVCMDDYSVASIYSSFGVKTSATISYVFYVDTNGEKQPNMLGKDVFILVFKEETGNFVPAGNDRTEDEVKQNCSKSGNGYWCLTLVKNRGWKVFDPLKM